MAENQRTFLRCRIGKQWYGIDVNHVIEVLYFMYLTEVPGSSGDLLGMMTLRDTVIPVRDLRYCFGLTDAKPHRDIPIIAIKMADESFGAIVDDVDGLTTFSENQISTQYNSVSPYITAVARSKDDLLLLLDMTTLMPEVN